MLNLKIVKQNLIQSFKKYKLDIPMKLVLHWNPDHQQMKPDHRGDGFIDRKRLSQTCLTHHISRGTVFNPLNRCILWGKKQINVVLDTVTGRTSADPFARLLFRDVVMKQARFRQWQTGTQHRQSVTLGQAWAFDRWTESRGLILCALLQFVLLKRYINKGDLTYP